MRLMQVFASPELVLEAPASMLMDIPGIGAQLARHISSWRSIVNPYRELELADKAGATVTTVFDASYPAALRELTDAPIVLYSWGSWTAGDSERSIAVVGSRMATHYGRLCARTVSHDLAEAGVTVISGLARGVDTEAHTEPWMRGDAPSPSSERASANCIHGKTETWRSALRTAMER